MAVPPPPEFGKRRPAAIATAPPVKRSGHVALLLMGSFAVGGGAYGLMPAEHCEPARPAMAAPSGLQSSAECPPRGSSGGGHGFSGGSWSRRSFFGGDSASGPSASGAASDADSGSVTRGGFGSFGRALAAHFSGGG